VQGENMGDLGGETVRNDGVTKRRRWLVPAIFALAAAAVIATVFSFVSTRGNRKDALQLKAEIARLNTGLGPQGNLYQLSQQVRNSLEAQTKSDSAARDSLKAQSDDLRKKVAAGGGNTDSLRQQLAETQNRLKL